MVLAWHQRSPAPGRRSSSPPGGLGDEPGKVRERGEHAGRGLSKHLRSGRAEQQAGGLVEIGDPPARVDHEHGVGYALDDRLARDRHEVEQAEAEERDHVHQGREIEREDDHGHVREVGDVERPERIGGPNADLTQQDQRHRQPVGGRPDEEDRHDRRGEEEQAEPVDVDDGAEGIEVGPDPTLPPHLGPEQPATVDGVQRRMDDHRADQEGDDGPRQEATIAGVFEREPERDHRSREPQGIAEDEPELLRLEVRGGHLRRVREAPQRHHEGAQRE